MKIRTVRFNSEEEALIEAFLRKNPVFDFSTLAKLAIRQFVTEPKLKISKVKTTNRGKDNEARL